MRRLGGLTGRCNGLAGIGAILGEVVHEEVDADTTDNDEDDSTHGHRGPHVFAALFIDLSVFRARRVAVIQRKNGRVVLERLATHLLEFARRSRVEIGDAIPALHADGGHLLERVFLLDTGLDRRMQAVDPLRHDHCIAAVLAEQRPEVFHGRRKWLALVDVELVHLIDNDQRIFELVRDTPLARVILRACEQLRHVLGIDQHQQLLDVALRNAQVLGDAIKAQTIEPCENAPTLLERRENVILYRVVALAGTRHTFVENEHVTKSPPSKFDATDRTPWPHRSSPARGRS